MGRSCHGSIVSQNSMWVRFLVIVQSRGLNSPQRGLRSNTIYLLSASSPSLLQMAGVACLFQLSHSETRRCVPNMINISLTTSCIGGTFCDPKHVPASLRPYDTVYQAEKVPPFWGFQLGRGQLYMEVLIKFNCSNH